MCDQSSIFFFFFLNDTAPPEISTLPLHDALPISLTPRVRFRIVVQHHHHIRQVVVVDQERLRGLARLAERLVQERLLLGERVAHEALGKPRKASDRKSTRLDSSHLVNSYAVFCLK